jgi:hypothetical protein
MCINRRVNVDTINRSENNQSVLVEYFDASNA